MNAFRGVEGKKTQIIERNQLEEKDDVEEHRAYGKRTWNNSQDEDGERDIYL